MSLMCFKLFKYNHSKNALEVTKHLQTQQEDHHSKSGTGIVAVCPLLCGNMVKSKSLKQISSFSTGVGML